MGLGTLILGGLAAGALLALGDSVGSEKEYVSVSSGKWNDEIGSSFERNANSDLSSFNREVGNVTSALKKVESTKPIQFDSQADEINRLISQINSLGN